MPVSHIHVSGEARNALSTPRKKIYLIHLLHNAEYLCLIYDHEIEHEEALVQPVEFLLDDPLHVFR